jgi:hypothetical protein
MRKRVFIAHQLSGDLAANLESAKRWCKWAIYMRDVNPIAPYLILMYILDEKIEEERCTGLILGDEYIPMCDELWICGPLPSDTSHVWTEIEIAKEHKVKTADYTGLVLPSGFHSVKSTTGPAALLVDKNTLVCQEELTKHVQ